MAESANTHLLVNVRDRTGGTYNSAQFNAVGENIIQGQIKKISVSEVLFPYDIPNVQAGFNEFEIYTNAGSTISALLTITVPPGFYTGTELAADITALIIAEGAAVPAPDGPLAPADVPTCVYDPISNRFTFVGPTNPAFAQDWVLASPYTYPFNYVGVATPLLGKDLLSIMGFKDANASGQIGPGVGGVQVAQGGSAPLVFTQYIDICSPQLCKYQFFRDGTTTNLARRLDVVCRLYIEDETSTPAGFDLSGNPILAGSRPFVIHRQFKNERIMRWTSDGAIGTMDLQLYDDVGQPLLTSYAPRPYQITFLAYEMDKAPEQNGGYRY
jgi:hypothetical protein